MGKGTLGKGEEEEETEGKNDNRPKMSLHPPHALDKTREFPSSLLSYKALSIEE